MSLLFETIKVANNTLLNLDYHNARVNQTRRKLFGADDNWDLQTLIRLPELNSNLVYKCKFIYDKYLHSMEYQPYTMRILQTLKLVESPEIDYSLKYLDRSALDLIKQDNRNFDDIIIVQNNRLTDCSFANIIFYDGAKWLTPSSPLLKGIKRQKYIDHQVIFEQDIIVSDLKFFTKARIINAMIDLEESQDILMDNIIKI